MKSIRRYGYARMALWTVALAVLWAGVMTEANANPYVILPDGRRVEGESIRARANGDITLSSQGREVTYTRGQYREAWSARPPQFDQARQLVQQRRFDDAIPILEELVTRFRWLGWDQEALTLLGIAQNGKEEYAAALATFERVFQLNPARREEPNARWGYNAALLGAGQTERLQGLLDTLVAEGSRADAARAQVMRGDIKMKSGFEEDALLDYLRTVVLFQAETAAQPEALFKAGEILEKMRDPRAREMYRRIVENFGQSPYAQRARAKL